MSLGTRLREVLAPLTGSEPQTVRLTDAEQQLEVDLASVDRLSCAIREIRLTLPELAGQPFERLTAWADRLCQRITYLMERLAPLEVFPQESEVLVRSSPPDRRPGRIDYYEVLIRDGGRLAVQRYRRAQESDTRERIDWHLTHDMAERLVDDLVEAAGQERL